MMNYMNTNKTNQKQKRKRKTAAGLSRGDSRPRRGDTLGHVTEYTGILSQAQGGDTMTKRKGETRKEEGETETTETKRKGERKTWKKRGNEEEGIRKKED